MLRHARRPLVTAALLIFAAPPLQAGVPAEIRRQFDLAAEESLSDEDRQAFCRNAGISDMSYSTSAKCADTFNGVLRRLRNRDQVIERMYESHRAEMTSADIAEYDRIHGKLHELIDWTRKLAVQFEERKGRASY